MSAQKPSRLVYFCHGVPGSEHDSAFLKDALPADVELVAPDLFLSKGDPTEACIRQFDEVTAGTDVSEIHVVGFSIGTMAAAHIASARADRVTKLTLVSCAAPLSLGDFLPKTAGAPVFKLAKSSPGLLKILIVVQRLIFRVRPALFLNGLFAKCGPQEKELIGRPSVSRVLRAGLANSLVDHPESYAAYLKAYVADWSAVFSGICCPVDLWHGTADTWSPLEMAHAIKAALPTDVVLHVVEGSEHYSTLKAYSEHICRNVISESA